MKRPTHDHSLMGGDFAVGPKEVGCRDATRVLVRPEVMVEATAFLVDEDNAADILA